MKSIIIAAAMTLCVVSFASADTLIMRDGTRIQGTVTGIAGRTVTFRHADGVSRRYPTSHVASLEFFSADRANPRAASGRRLEAPAGTELVVRTVETIDSRNSSADQSFSAVIERAVSDESGRLIVPAKSSAQLVIRQVSSSGKARNPEMALDLLSITVDGRRYLVSTADLTEDARRPIGSDARTAETVGGGAAVGTIVGAIAGGKGSAVGAQKAGADEAATQLFTEGRDIKVPAETLLTFRLDKPVTLRADQ